MPRPPAQGRGAGAPGVGAAFSPGAFSPSSLHPIPEDDTLRFASLSLPSSLAPSSPALASDLRRCPSEQGGLSPSFCPSQSTRGHAEGGDEGAGWGARDCTARDHSTSSSDGSSDRNIGTSSGDGSCRTWAGDGSGSGNASPFPRDHAPCTVPSDGAGSSAVGCGAPAPQRGVPDGAAGQGPSGRAPCSGSSSRLTPMAPMGCPVRSPGSCPGPGSGSLLPTMGPMRAPAPVPGPGPSWRKVSFNQMERELEWERERQQAYRRTLLLQLQAEQQQLMLKHQEQQQLFMLKQQEEQQQQQLLLLQGGPPVPTAGAGAASPRAVYAYADGGMRLSLDVAHAGPTYGAGTGVQRMWEGELCDCWEDSAGAARTACCPCVTFGENMAMAGLGDCRTQALVYLGLTYGACSMLQLTGLCCSFDFFSTLGFGLFFAGATYAAHFRTEMRRRFNIHGDESTDCMYHAFCSCCALCQESRTLKVNNVHKGVWGGRSDMCNVVVQQPKNRLVAPEPCQMSADDGSVETALWRLVQGGLEAVTALQEAAAGVHDCMRNAQHQQSTEGEGEELQNAPSDYLRADSGSESHPSSCPAKFPASEDRVSSPRSHPFAPSAQQQSDVSLLQEGYQT